MLFVRGLDLSLRRSIQVSYPDETTVEEVTAALKRWGCRVVSIDFINSRTGETRCLFQNLGGPTARGLLPHMVATPTFTEFSARPSRL